MIDSINVLEYFLQLNIVKCRIQLSQLPGLVTHVFQMFEVQKFLEQWGSAYRTVQMSANPESATAKRCSGVHCSFTCRKRHGIHFKNRIYGMSWLVIAENTMTLYSCCFFQVCPVCAAYPGGEPNHVIDDLAAHLMLEHRTSNSDIISFFSHFYEWYSRV